MRKIIKIHENDNVVVALEEIPGGTIIEVDGNQIQLKSRVLKGHKIILKNINKGEDIVKYGYPIGKATKNISVGEVVHIMNIKTKLNGTINYEYKPKDYVLNIEDRGLTFKGYRRYNGEIGIRNELWIVPTVGCVNSTADQIIRSFKQRYEVITVDDVCVLKHPYGCSQLGCDHENTVKILTDMVKHPNAGGVLVLGLGCENNNIYDFKEYLGKYNNKRVKFLNCQDCENEIEAGVNLLKELYSNILKDKREVVPLSELKVGLKCGGSDGLSGITANPLVGLFSDFLIAQGGTTILTEVPEMFGAETILMEKAKNEGVFNDIVKLINDYKDYYMKYNQPIYENPSPGNKKGGISTLEDKSLGCVQKGGMSKVVDVLNYGDRLKKRGLNLLSSPGNDLIATTALAASGCQLVLFTTGRGTPFGGFVPTIKISTNTDIYNKKPHWIDFDAGTLTSHKSSEETLDEFINYIIEVASGKIVNNEKNKFKEISIFKTGVTL